MAIKTGERLIPKNCKLAEGKLLYLRHLFAYEFAKFNIPKNSNLLEVGFGEGYGISLLSNSKKFKKIHALDINYDCIKNAKEKYNFKNLSFEIYDGKKIPFKDNSFDAIISFQVIEHIKNDSGFINEIHRVLKKGGILILTTPNRNYRLKPNQKLSNPFHVREYSPQSFKKLLNNKFSSMSIKGIIGTPDVQKIELNRVKKFESLNLIDPFKLRRFISNKIRSSFKDILRETSKKFNKKNNIKYSLKNFYVTNKNVDKSLDLLALCQK